MRELAFPHAFLLVVGPCILADQPGEAKESVDGACSNGSKSMDSREKSADMDVNSQAHPSLHELLLASPEWGALTPDELDLVESAATLRERDPGDILFNVGDAGTGVFIVRNGLVRVRREGSDGNAILFHVSRAGQSIGFQPVLSEQTHRAMADTVTSAATWFVPRAQILLLLRQNAEFALRIIKRLANSLGSELDSRYETQFVNLQERVYRLLIQIEDEFGVIDEDGTKRTHLPMTRHDLADMLCIRRETLSRVLHDLGEAGMIELQARDLRIPH